MLLKNMLSIRDNFWETIKGGNPDRFVNQYEYLGMISTPFSATLPRPVKGGPPVVDAWGVTRLFPENTPGPFPDRGDRAEPDHDGRKKPPAEGGGIRMRFDREFRPGRI